MLVCWVGMNTDHPELFFFFASVCVRVRVHVHVRVHVCVCVSMCDHLPDQRIILSTKLFQVALKGCRTFKGWDWILSVGLM